MAELFIVGVSGFFGSISRYLVYLWMGPRDPDSFPWATLIVNVLGCLLIGIFSVFIAKSIPYHRQLFLIGSVGFLGAFTTFSAFGLESVELIRHQQMTLAALNVAANVLVGFAAVWLGRVLASLF